VDEAEAAARDIKIVMLMDIRDIFARLFPEDGPAHRAERTGRPNDGPRLLTKRLLDELHRLEERQWSAWGKAKKPMTDTALASLLRTYRIRSNTVRGEDIMGNPERGKGYYLRSFKDAFSRYLPPYGPSTRDNETNPENVEGAEVFKDVTNTECHGSQDGGNASNSGIWHDGTGPEGGNRDAEAKDRDKGAFSRHGAVEGDRGKGASCGCPNGRETGDSPRGDHSEKPYKSAKPHQRYWGDL
jgi:hypothetical protein